MMKKMLLVMLSLVILSIVPVTAGCGGLPSAAFQADTISGAVPLNVTFTNNTQKAGADSKIVFDWDFGDGGKQTATLVTDSISHKYTRVGTYTVTLTGYSTDAPDKTSINTQTITVTHGAISKINVKPETVELNIGQTQAFTSEAFDAYDNPITEASLSWKDGDAGLVTSGGSFTAGKVAGVFEKGVIGNGEFNGSSAQGSPKITILPDPMETASLDTLEIGAGESKQLVAVAKDKYGNSIDNLDATWSVANTNAGAITKDGLFTASKRAASYDGAIKVVVKQGDKSLGAAGKVTIKAGQITQLAIAPDKIDLGKSMSQQYIAVGADKYGNKINDITCTWSCSAAAGTITADGLFTSGVNVNNYAEGITVTAKYNGTELTKKAAVNVEGDSIIFASTRDDVNDEIIKHYTMDIDGSNVKEIILGVAGSIDDRIECSSDGRRILYTDVILDDEGYLSDGYTHIANTDGKWGTTIVSGKFMFEPSISSDGLKIAYQSWAEDDSEICVVDIDGGNFVNLTENTVYDDYPDWSPDGTKIAYVTSQDDLNFGMPMIYTMNADGTKKHKLTEGNMYATVPQWSLDGKEILFQGGNILTGDWGIYIMNADGTDVRAISTPAGFNSISPKWSPDGKTIVFDSNMKDDQYDIYTINRDKTNLTRLTDHENSDYSATWLMPKKGVEVDASSVIIKEDFGEPNMTAQAISNQVKDAVVRIETKITDGTVTGSGFIIRPNGLILTNNHVISDAESITVFLPDGKEYTGTVLSRDMVHDLALVKINAADLPTIEIGGLSGVESGQQVVVLGYPLGNETVSVTSGLVSTIEFDDGINTTWIQTDSAINPGNSGGPLLDMHGRVIGVVAAKIFGIGVEGIGYAISADTVNLYLAQLLEKAGL